MQVREAMSSSVLSIGPQHSLRHAAQLMAQRRVGSAVVLDNDGEGPGILTERDILEAVAQGQDLDQEAAADHLTSDLVFASPDWSLDDAATAMVRGNFRHLVVMDGDDLVGMISVRDIVRCWTENATRSAGVGGTTTV